MSLSSLVLYTEDSSASLVHAELIELIHSIELAGQPLGLSQFLAGSRFFSHITFLGCAPNIALQPEQGPNYIRISIPPLKKPMLLSGNRTPAPLCPDCKQILTAWKTLIEKEEAVSCPHCDVTTPVSGLNFRKRACFSQNIIRIEPVFESEAIPANDLLDMLSKAFNTHFKYAYIGA